MRGKAIDWRETDWEENDEKIAQTLGCGVSTVRNKRADLGLPPRGWTGQKKYERKYNINWGKVDWTKSRRVLACELGVSEKVIRNRKKVYENQNLR